MSEGPPGTCRCAYGGPSPGIDFIYCRSGNGSKGPRKLHALNQNQENKCINRLETPSKSAGAS